MESPGVLGRRTASPDQQRVAALPEGCAVPRQVLVLSEKDWRSCCLGPGASPQPSPTADRRSADDRRAGLPGRDLWHQQRGCPCQSLGARSWSRSWSSGANDMTHEKAARALVGAGLLDSIDADVAVAVLVSRSLDRTCHAWVEALVSCPLDKSCVDAAIAAMGHAGRRVA